MNRTISVSPSQKACLEKRLKAILTSAAAYPEILSLDACMDGSTRHKEVELMAYTKDGETQWPVSIRFEEVEGFFSELRAAAGWEKYFKGQGAICWLIVHVHGEQAGRFSASIHRFKTTVHDVGDHQLENRDLGMAIKPPEHRT